MWTEKSEGFFLVRLYQLTYLKLQAAYSIRKI